MSETTHHDQRECCPGPGNFISDSLGRRGFVQVGLGGSMSLLFAQWLSEQAQAGTAATTPTTPATAKNVILLWMNGGPSHLDTWDPKLGNGSFKSIPTRQSGVQICEHLPQAADVANELAIIRGMTSREGNHQRAQYLLHTGYAPLGGMTHPAFGAVVAKEVGVKAFDLPNFVSIRGRGFGAGYLGTEYAPFVVTDATRPVQNLGYAQGLERDRFMRRIEVLGYLEQDFATLTNNPNVGSHKTVYDKALKMMHSPLIKAFNVAEEPLAVKKAYGVPENAGEEAAAGGRMMMMRPGMGRGQQGAFAAGCLMARRLVERGVKFVEVVLDGWDTHQDNFTRTKDLMMQFDAPMAHLLRDLKQRNLLTSTLVVWMGEFGRTPRVNANDGRDHFPQAWSAVLAGGGVKGNQVIGQTSDDGSRVVNDPVEVGDLFRSLCRALGINADKNYFAPNGRPMKIVDKGKVVERLFA